MAGFIETRDGHTTTFYIGETPRCTIEDIVSVQLDGQELDRVPHVFNNIPFNVKQRVQVWRGDFARFIVENW